ncbi:hypothetical protein OG887_43230 (plasmid) [Streptomyces sp. NBC_00053]|uniref:effector-associated constant component EACC1 n=1 Tax=unclassified Streptomyces TaxID=2593676 RepID=UPI0022570083|nr:MULTISPECIES: hypothetical protein [unclassified Streptomyces]MCX4400079.1 hypothetical protein [Streptomyces sp. NBC_01767]MCX5106703.1 hypothetical protein [Streptomyces sp. NBC_00439]MCX5106766.1 hypothetical protein [Streptomyces sp. NBC_00439]MCX5506127.1 hypothetical protein [Streptomyces sp. NBC_00052]MCX5554170.1 hypothetical protein [Streptomyces sp. NBC_00051]
MSVTVALAGAGTADELRSLHEWLSAEEELRGRVRLVQSPPPPNALGSVPEMLTVALAPGGVSAVLASAAIAWMRHRTGEVVCKLTKPDGTSVEVSAQRVRGSDVAEVRELVTELTQMLNDSSGVVGGGSDDPAAPSGQ